MNKAEEQPDKKRKAEDSPSNNDTAAKVVATPGVHEKKMYLVLFVTDYRKEHDFRAHKVFHNKADAITEAKKFTTPGPDCEPDCDGEEPPFEWEYTCPSSTLILEDRCRNSSIDPGVSGMVVTVVEVDSA